MCGIVGVAGNLLASHGKIFREMLLMDVVRGWDSTGVVQVNNSSNTPITEKEVGCPPNLWDDGKGKVFNSRGLPRIVGKAYIGHNRAATIGNVTATNAHPFTFGHITGVHNGTLRDWIDLEGAKDFDVDSKALYKTIAEKGIEHCWKSFIGAAALVWWDEKEGTLNLIRNSERPLYIAESVDKKVLLWASEPHMIQAAVEKHKVFLAGRKDKAGNNLNPIFQLKEDTLHSYKVSVTNCELVEVKELAKKPVPRVTYQSQLTRVGGRKHYSGPKKYSIPMNSSWANALTKAGKECRGVMAEFAGLFSYPKSEQTPGILFKGARLKAADGTLIEVFPADEDEYEQWENRMLYSRGRLFFKLEHRPRILTDKDGNFQNYRVASSGVKLSHSIYDPKHGQNKPEKKVVELREYRGHDKDVPLTKEEWEREVKNASGCVWCCSGVESSEHKEVKWLEKSHYLCPTCSKEPEVLNHCYEMGVVL